jgi:hypothetical protein
MATLRRFLRNGLIDGRRDIGDALQQQQQQLKHSSVSILINTHCRRAPASRLRGSARQMT